jgi:hypothetical protein
MIRSVAIVVRWGELIAALATQRCARQGDTSLTIGSARVEPSVRRAASLGNDGATAVRAVPRPDLHPAVAAEEGRERIPRAMRPSLCGHGAVTLVAVHDTAHLPGHRVPAYRANSGSKISGCRPREPVEPCARLLRAVRSSGSGCPRIICSRLSRLATRNTGSPEGGVSSLVGWRGAWEPPASRRLRSVRRQSEPWERTFTVVPLGSRSMRRRTPHSSSRMG